MVALSGKSTIADNISIFIDENKVENMLDAPDIDSKISKLEELRTGSEESTTN